MNYVSGWVDTQNKFFTTYGRYEFRAQMPAGGQGKKKQKNINNK